jgi:long-subunit acyl-CoA synthetase (AMP-forming)
VRFGAPALGPGPAGRLANAGAGSTEYDGPRSVYQSMQVHDRAASTTTHADTLGQCIARAAEAAPARTATTFGGRSHTWGQFADRVARLADGLRALGVAPGDRVAFLASNSDRYMEWFFAVAWAGAVFVPINTRLAPPEVEQVLADSAAGVLFTDDEFTALAAVRGRPRELVHVGEGGPPASSWHASAATGTRPS